MTTKHFLSVLPSKPWRLLAALTMWGWIPAASGELCDAGQIVTPIHQVQGSGSASPMVGETVTVEGLVTKKVTQFSTNDRGLYLQTPADREDGDEATSEGIFVRLDTGVLEDIGENDLIRVKGTVVEHYNETRISPADQLAICQRAGEHSLAVKVRTLPASTILQKWQDGSDSMERYEGMKVLFSGTIIRPYSYDYAAYRNNMGLAREIQFKPTQLHRPGPEADALVESNRQNRIVLEEGDTKKNGDIGYYPPFGPADYPLRIGSTVTDIPVVIGYAYGKYFMVAAGQWQDTTVTAPTDPDYRWEPTAPPRSPDQYRAAGLNLLNFFTDDTVEGAPKSSGNRGAENPGDFYLQRLKLTRAIESMDADILALLEVGNNGKEAKSAIANLVATLNYGEPDADKHYLAVFPDTDKIGTDAISVGLIYRSSVFTASGDPEVLTMPRETSDSGGIIGQRDSLVQAFCQKDDNDSLCLTVIVNHFKSKRCSDCKDDTEKAPLQGCCTNLRVSAAVRLGEYVKPLTAAGKKVLVLGDFNAYGEEDPLYALTATTIDANENVRVSSVADIPGLPDFDKTAPLTAGYGLTSLVKAKQDARAFSYSYDAELGSLDHALASPNLVGGVSHVYDWHINSLESNLFEYSGEYTGDLPKGPGPGSCSDHDPVIVDFRL